MPPLKVLFGTVGLLQDDRQLECLASAKAKELLYCLLLHRDRHHSREVLTILPWSNCTTILSKQCFRQTLWQLQQWLREASSKGKVSALGVKGESLRFNSQSDLWLDTTAFEQAFIPVQAITVGEMDTRQWQVLRKRLPCMAEGSPSPPTKDFALE